MAALARRDPRLVAGIRAAVNRYAEAGHGDVVKLQGRPEFRLRVGTWRVMFDLDRASDRIVVLTVGPRKDVYR